MNISAYDVIYKELVYKCVDVMTDCITNPEATGIQKPKFLYVTYISSDGDIVTLHDEAFMFRFVRKSGDAHA